MIKGQNFVVIRGQDFSTSLNYCFVLFRLKLAGMKDVKL